MNYLCLFTTIICCIFCYKRDKTVFSPSVAFSGLFSIIFIFASSGWYGMYSAPDSAYSLITIGVLSFLIGTVVMKKYSLKNAFYITGKNINENDRLHSRIYWRMFWLCILVLMSSIIMIGTYIIRKTKCYRFTKRNVQKLKRSVLALDTIRTIRKQR